MAETTARRPFPGTPTDEAAPPVQRRGIETRWAIEKAATELFAELGYHATSMQKISQAAGIRAAAIYHWFPSKEALLVHLQDDFMDRLEESVQAEVSRFTTGAERLGAAVRAHVVFHGLHTQEAFVTDSEIRALSPDARKVLTDRRDRYEDLFEGAIRAGVDEGAFTTSSSRVATYAILIQCTGVALWFTPRGPLTLDEVADLHVALVLGSLRTSGDVVDEVVAAVRTPAEKAASANTADTARPDDPATP